MQPVVRRALRSALVPLAITSALVALDAPRAACQAPPPAPAGSTPHAGEPLEFVGTPWIREEQTLPIDYATALRLATAKSLDIRQAKARLEEDRGKHLMAIGALLPSLTTALATRHIDGEIQASFGELDRRSFSTVNPVAAFGVSFNLGEAIFDVLAARKRVGASEHASEAVVQETLARVAAGYFEFQSAQSRIGIAKAAAATIAEVSRLARDREELGTGLAADRARAEARLANANVEVTTAEERFRRAAVALAEALVLDPTVRLVPVEWQIEPLSLIREQRTLDADLQVAVAKRPELREVELRAREADDARAAAWWQALGPTTYATVEESGIGRSFDTIGNRQIYGGFVGWTLSPGSVGEVRAAAARATQAALRRVQIDQAIRAEVVRAHDLLFTARQRIAAARQGFAAAEQSLDLNRDRFSSGVGLELEVFEAQETLTRTRTDLVDAITALNTTQVALLRSVGEVSVETLGATTRVNAP